MTAALIHGYVDESEVVPCAPRGTVKWDFGPILRVAAHCYSEPKVDR